MEKIGKVEKFEKIGENVKKWRKLENLERIGDD